MSIINDKIDILPVDEYSARDLFDTVSNIMELNKDTGVAQEDGTDEITVAVSEAIDKTTLKLVYIIIISFQIVIFKIHTNLLTKNIKVKLFKTNINEQQRPIYMNSNNIKISFNFVDFQKSTSEVLLQSQQHSRLLYEVDHHTHTHIYITN